MSVASSKNTREWDATHLASKLLEKICRLLDQRFKLGYVGQDSTSGLVQLTGSIKWNKLWWRMRDIRIPAKFSHGLNSGDQFIGISLELNQASHCNKSYAQIPSVALYIVEGMEPGTCKIFILYAYFFIGSNCGLVTSWILLLDSNSIQWKSKCIRWLSYSEARLISPVDHQVVNAGVNNLYLCTWSGKTQHSIINDHNLSAYSLEGAEDENGITDKLLPVLDQFWVETIWTVQWQGSARVRISKSLWWWAMLIVLLAVTSLLLLISLAILHSELFEDRKYNLRHYPCNARRNYARSGL